MFLSVFLTLLATGSANDPPKGCNPSMIEKSVFQPPTEGAKAGPVTFLPQDKGNESPACLDGTPYGFYFVPSTTNSTKWTISINGGGWCYDEVDCWCRSNMDLGTSKNLAPTETCSCLNPLEDGSFDQDCNCIHMPYSDGASFSGYRAEPWAVPGTTDKLYFRGIKNLDGVLDFAFKHGMTEATEFVLTGGSAGGLSTFLHADRVANRLKAEAPKCSHIRAAPVVGYFLDHDNFAHTTGYPGGPNSPQWSKPGTAANYTMWMKYIYSMQNLTFGADGGLTKACEAQHPEEPWLCFMSPHMNSVMETPFFMFNSKYDAWQLGNEFQSNWNTHAEQKGVLQYGEDFMAQFKIVAQSGNNGAMITSCICHGCPWPELELDGKATYQHYADWYYGKATGAAAIHIDPRLPNGGGTFTYRQCARFPNLTMSTV